MPGRLVEMDRLTIVDQRKHAIRMLVIGEEMFFKSCFGALGFDLPLEKEQVIRIMWLLPEVFSKCVSIG
jgi:hypothetical protein